MPTRGAASCRWTASVGTSAICLAGAALLAVARPRDEPSVIIFGSLLQRMLYHYWYHTGESLAIRQMLRHGELPEFVGDIDGEAPYRPEQVNH
jgi:hypothetical protein